MAFESSVCIIGMYLLYLEHISANDNSAVTILEAATGPGIRSLRPMRVTQQSTKTQIYKENKIHSCDAVEFAPDIDS